MPRLYLLDGLRGTAALAVMIYHSATNRSEESLLFGTGYLAVDFFFILSGFVLALAFEPKFSKGLEALDFMILRVKRLWPALTVGALLGGAALMMENPSSMIVPLIVMTLMMISHGQDESHLFFLNPVQWSLAFEVLANLAHVVVFARLSNRALVILLGFVALILALEIHHFGTVALGSMRGNFIYGIPRALFSYILGIVLARHWRSGPALPTRGWWLLPLAPVAVIIAVSILPISLRGLGEAAAVFLAMPLVFLLASRARPPRGAERWLSQLGAISYPLYAVHYPILKMAALVQGKIAPESPNMLWNLAAMGTAIVVAQCMALAGSLVLSRKTAQLRSPVAIR